MATRASARAVKIRFSRIGIARKQSFERKIVRLFRTCPAGIQQAPMQERNYICNLSFAELDRRHPFCRAAISNHRTDEITLVVMTDERRADQIRPFGRARGIRSVTKTTRLRKLLLTSLRRFRWRQFVRCR